MEWQDDVEILLQKCHHRRLFLEFDHRPVLDSWLFTSFHLQRTRFRCISLPLTVKSRVTPFCLFSHGNTRDQRPAKSNLPTAWPCRWTLPLAKNVAGFTRSTPFASGKLVPAGAFPIHSVQSKPHIIAFSPQIITLYRLIDQELPL